MMEIKVNAFGQAVEMTLRQPDDWHWHPRLGEMLEDLLPYEVEAFAVALWWGNHPGNDAIIDTRLMLDFQRSIARKVTNGFKPQMSILVSESTAPLTLKLAKVLGALAAKAYPWGVTNAANGIKDFESMLMHRNYQMMEQCDLVLSGHWEIPAVGVDENTSMFARERLCVPVFHRLHKRYPNLRKVFEHASTEDAIIAVMLMDDKVAVTITPTHLSSTKQRFWDGSKIIDPAWYGRPVLQGERDRRTIVEYVVSEDSRAFYGGDKAAHDWLLSKQIAVPKPGVYMTPASAISVVAEELDAAGHLDKMEAFCSIRGRQFYGLPIDQKMVTYRREDWLVPDMVPYRGGYIVPAGVGEVRRWKRVA